MARSEGVRGSAPPGRVATHQCAATGCHKPIRVDLLMCRDHWSMLPQSMRSKVWSYYRVRFEDLRGYLDAVSEAVAEVDRREGWRTP